MRIRVAALLAFTFVAPASAQRAPTLQGPLATAKALKCSFPTFAAVRWADAGPEAIGGTQEFSFVIDSFDVKRNRARLVADGSTLVSLLTTPTGLSVIEQTPAGNLTVTTVFAGTAGEGRSYLSVHSRHLGDPDAAPRASQAYGRCELP